MRSSLRQSMHVLRALAVLAVALSFAFARPLSALALDVGEVPPDLPLKTLSGKPISFAELRGKVVVVDFWASWCAPCKEEMPILQGLHKKHGGRGLVIVGVSVDQDRAKAESFVRDLKVSFPIVHDDKHALADRIKPPRMPTSFILDRDGKVRFVHAGFHKDDAPKIEREIEQLLK